MLIAYALLALQAAAPPAPEPVEPPPRRLHAARVQVLCPSSHAGDAGKLLDRERSQSDLVMRRSSAVAWAAVGCTRALLELAGAVGREGPAMPMGDPWALGAINAMARAMALDPSNSVAAEVLALLVLAEEADDVNRSVIDVVLGAANAPQPLPAMLRACSELAIRIDDTAGATRCANKALARGDDSTWHLIRLARLAFRGGDTTAGVDAFTGAARHVQDASARNELDWHLRWFLSPDELRTWSTLADTAAGAFIRDRLASRDVRDGRGAGSRLAEHFTRLEVVLARFRLHVARHVRTRGGFIIATPEQWRIPDPHEVLSACEPGTVPAQPSRFYDRWQWVIDDRGAVWMRYGPPDRRVEISPRCPGAPPSPNVREMWRYDIDGEPLLLHFENEMFDGSASATRLVIGVLGSYMCDLDVARCVMSSRTAMPGGLPPERLEVVRVQDQAYLTLATTGDDNSPRGLRPIRVAARLHRLRDPVTDAPLAMVSYAIRLGDLVRTGGDASVALTLRWWDPAAGITRDTTIMRQHPVADGSDTTRSLTGYLVVEGSDGITTWNLSAAQPERVGRATGVDESPVAEGAVRISDLLTGSPGSGLVWSLRGEPVPVAPAGRVDRMRPISLYYQVTSDALREAVFTTYIFTPIERGQLAPRTALEVRIPGRLEAGMNEVAPEIDASRLDRGIYQLEVRIADTRATLARRLTTITLD